MCSSKLICQEIIFKEKRTGILHISSMDVDPGFKYVKSFRGGIQWYMIERKDFISNISFKLKKENGN